MRNIEPQMVTYLDQKLASNGLAQQAIKEKDARLLFRLAAEACVGIQEATGQNDGKMVELIQKTIGDAVGEPWCMAFVQTCIAYAEVKTGVKSPIIPSEHCQTVYNKTPRAQRVKLVPLPGALMIFADVGKSSGHVEVVLGSDGNTVHCVGGNTSGSKSPDAPVNREGNGVFYTVRSAKGTKSRRIMGYLKPF